MSVRLARDIKNRLAGDHSRRVLTFRNTRSSASNLVAALKAEGLSARGFAGDGGVWVEAALSRKE